MAEHGHGHSRAAWTAVTILLVASFLISLSVVVTSWLLAIFGLVLVVVGVVAGKVLAMAGFGQTKPARSTETTAVR
ncbi:MAG: HGxxPAAW family protein [Dermatophilaceae bacterium]